MTGTAAALRRAVAAVRWYLREVTGEAAYDHYLTRHRQLHGSGVTALPRREFERERWTRQGQTPGNRCC